MKPHSLSSAQLTPKVFTHEERMTQLGPHAERFGIVKKGTILPETNVEACPRVKVKDLPPGFLPLYYIEALEHNQMIASCCRHPENHEIEARKSHPDEQLPDIYIFHCTCGRKHRRFHVGMTDKEPRPMWKAD
jgi:hypothetical protein